MCRTSAELLLFGVGRGRRMIHYRKGYKYQLAQNYTRDTHLIGYSIETEFINLDLEGCLFIRSGYSWDGVSGPTPFSPDSGIESSLVHDALYQLMRMELLPQTCRAYADNLFKKICITKGMWRIRASAWHYALKKFGGLAANPKQLKKVYVVP